MNSLYKIEVCLSFPLGAYFHQNVTLYIYKTFLKMVKKLSCTNNGKCCDCLFSSNCQYFNITGQNFKYYPGVIFDQEMIENNIFRENDELKLNIYFIGNCSRYNDYLNIFFKEYLDYTLAGHAFLIKSINNSIVYDELQKFHSLKIRSLIETLDFQTSYNNMVTYYNKYYCCNYELINNLTELINVKKINNNFINFETRKVFLKGYTYEIITNNYFSMNLLLLGIGKYNFLGGGKIANKS